MTSFLIFCFGLGLIALSLWLIVGSVKDIKIIRSMKNAKSKLKGGE